MIFVILVNSGILANLRKQLTGESRVSGIYLLFGNRKQRRF